MKVRTRKRENGKTYYYMDYRLNGRRHQREIKAVKTRKEATEVANLLWARIIRENALGEYAPETTADRCLRIGDALDADLLRTGISPWTLRMERSLGNHLRRILGGSTPVLGITEEDIERYKKTRLAEPARVPGKAAVKAGANVATTPRVKPITVNKELEFLRALLNRLKKKRAIPRLPVEITKLPVETHRARALTEAQLLAILAECAIHSEDMLEKTVFFSNTGFRKSELFNARWSDLEHTGGFILVMTRKKGLSDKYYEDLVPLNDAATQALASRKARLCNGNAGGDLIFGTPPSKRRHWSRGPGAGKPGTTGGIVCHWDHCYGDKLKNLARLAGLSWWKELRIHHLRHTFATISLDKGANIMEVSRLIRHRDPMQTVRTYLHTRDEGVAKVINGLNFGLGMTRVT